MLSYIFGNPIVAFVIMLGILVFVHEFGHYAAAKLFGVRVEVFSLGFGKRLFGFRRGDTDYRISALPLGGYVKMSGENPMEASTGDPGEFMSHPRWQRFIIALAGPAMNAVLAIVVLTGVFMAHYEREVYLDKPAMILHVAENSVAAKAGLQGNDRIIQVDGVNNPKWEDVLNKVAISIGRPLSLQVQRGNQVLTKELRVTSNDVTDNSDIRLVEQLGMSVEPFIVGGVAPNMPAERAGLKPQDKILKVNDTPVYSTTEFSYALKQIGEKPVVVQIERAGVPQNLTMTPEMQNDEDGTRRPMVGFGPHLDTRTENLSFAGAFFASLEQNKKNSLLIVEVLKKLLSNRVSITQMSGPIGIAQVSGKAAREGPLTFLMLMSLISLNLGIFNLLPIPILDGGLILLLAIESVMGQDIRREVKERVYQAAFVFLIIFAAVVIYNDITKTALGKLLHM